LEPSALRRKSVERLDTSLPVVVLKMHHGSLGIARSLGRLGVPVYGLTATRYTWSAASRYWRGCYEWDVESALAPRSLEYLLALGRRLGRGALLIPVSDQTTMFVAQHADALKEWFRFPNLSHEAVQSLTSKKEMYFLARKFGIPTPNTTFPQSREELIGLLDRTQFPVLLKGIDGIRLHARTGLKMAIVRSASELLEHYERMEDPASPNLMLQEYIPGGEDCVWMFNGYFNAESRCLVGFTGKKIRQTPVYTGSTSLGICLNNDEVAQITQAFMKAVGYCGILDIGYRYDARDGKYKVLDVNPRIGSTFRLFVDKSGLDVVQALYRDLTGQVVPQATVVDGRKWIVEDQDIYSSYRYWRDGKLGLAGWFVSLIGIREGAWFAWDDLRPFWLMCRSLLTSSARWATRRLFLPIGRRAAS
jgi:D-aspartate ligase